MMKTSALGSVYSPLERSRRENRFTTLNQETTRYPKYRRRHLVVGVTTTSIQGRDVNRHHQNTGVQGGYSTTSASLVKGDPMIETDQPPPDQIDTETVSLGLAPTGEGRLLTSTDNILNVARDPSLKATTVSGNAQQTTCKRQWGSPELGTSLAAPKGRVSAILYQHYVSETMQILCQTHNFREQIVDAFDISIRGRDFGTLQADKILSDGIIDWMLRWWTTQIGGDIGVNVGGGLTQTAPHLPRCYYVPSQWFTKLT